jgi:hypothetical protein
MPAKQVSQGWGGDPNRAVDGVKDGNFGSGQCTHTEYESEPWWSIYFGIERPVARVVVLNRADCCQGRLNGFKVFIGNDRTNFRANNPCGSSNSGEGEITVTCNPPVSGRYLFVAIPGRSDYLTLCSVEAYAPNGLYDLENCISLFQSLSTVFNFFFHSTFDRRWCIHRFARR